MNKKSLLIALLLLGMASVQCTEDETVEVAVSHSEIYSSESGEEGDQEIDNERD